MHGGGKKAPAPAAGSTFDGNIPRLEPVGQAGVDFDGLGSTGLGLGDLRPRDQYLSAPARVRLGYAVDEAPSERGGVNDDDLGPDSSSAHGTLWADGAGCVGGGAGPAPVFARIGRGVDPFLMPDEREPAAAAAAADLPRAGHDMLAGIMRPAALLVMQVGALTLITDLDAPWPNQFGAFLIWLAGCVALFLSRH